MANGGDPHSQAGGGDDASYSSMPPLEDVNPFGALGGGGEDSASETSMPPLEDVAGGGEVYDGGIMFDRRTGRANEGVSGGEHTCATVDPNRFDERRTEPDGAAFVNRSAVDPHRRIVRARRPPSQAQGNTAANADLSGAMRFLRQANREGTSGGGVTMAEISEMGAAGATDEELHARIFSGSAPRSRGPLGAEARISRASTQGRSVLERPTEEEENDEEDEDDGRYDDWEVEEEDDDYDSHEEDDEDEEEEYLPDPSTLFRGFMNYMSEMGERAAARRPLKLSKIRPDEDDEESDEEHDHEAGARCAACFRGDNQSHKWRRLVTLPCCGTNGREGNSSTRFCAACVLKLAVTRPDSSSSGEYRLADDEPDEYPVKRFYEENVQKDSRRFIECPRCRGILVVKIKGIQAALEESDEESEDDPCDCSDCVAERRARRANRGDAKTAKSISLLLPSFQGKCKYVGRKRGVAKILWKASLLHHTFMPYEALAAGDDDRPIISKLVGWGILERAGKNIYRMDREGQEKLCKLLHRSEKDSKDDTDLLHEFTACVLHAAWLHLRDEFRIDRSLRLVIRFFTLGLHFGGQLPPLPLSGLQELVVTTLIVFSAALAVQFVCVLAVYGLAFFGVGISVCYALRRSNNIKSFWWQAILLAYIIYQAMSIFYQSPYLQWSVLVTPRAMIPVKKIFWDAVGVVW